MHWYVDRHLPLEARSFVESLGSLSVRDWVEIRMAVMLPSGEYGQQRHAVNWRVMEAADARDLYRELAVAQVSAVDAVRALDWSEADENYKTDIEARRPVSPGTANDFGEDDEENYYFMEEVQADAESAAHLAAGAIVTMAWISDYDRDVAFAPFRGTRVTLPR